MTYLRAVALSWLLAVMGGCLLAYDMAHAGGFYLEGGLGATFFRNTVDDGTWRQDRIQPPNNRLLDLSWQAGLGYRWDVWSVQGHYLNWGTNVTKSVFVDDAIYYGAPCLATPCTTYARIMDRMYGVDLTATRHFPIKDSPWEPFVKFGGAIVRHKLTVHNNGVVVPVRYSGTIPMVVVGGGVCFRQVLCWDNSFYTGTLSMNGGCIGGGENQCGYPLAKQVVTSMVVIKIPLPGGQ